jgi:hypothetical protein
MTTLGQSAGARQTMEIPAAVAQAIAVLHEALYSA